MNKIQTCFLFALIATTTSNPVSEKIAVMGGNYIFGTNVDTVRCYDFAKTSWDYKCLPKLPVTLKNHGVVQVGTDLYLVGGVNNDQETTISMYIMDLNKRDVWRRRYNMSRPRRQHATAALDGLIYAVGGYDDDGATNTGEMFNTATQTWSAITPMSTKRYAFSLVPIGDKLYAIGGEDEETDYIKIIECYDPTNSSWSTIQTTNEMTDRNAPAVAVLNDKIYVAGGAAGNLQLPVNTLEMYDPQTKGWTTLKNMTFSRASATMVAFENKLYIFSGESGTGIPISSSEIYDPKTDEWTPFPKNFDNTIEHAASLVITTTEIQSEKMAVIGGDSLSKQVKCYSFTTPSWDNACLPEMPEGLHGLGVVQIDTKLYAVGGQDNKKKDSKSIMYILDLETRVWSEGLDMRKIRSAPSTAVLDGLIYVVGASDRDDTNTGEVFNPTEKKWKPIASMSTIRAFFSLVPVGNKLYAIGGVNGDGFIQLVECYDPVLNSWSTESSITQMTARAAAAVAVLDGKIYVAGGMNSYREHLNTLEMYDPQTKAWTTLENMASPRTYATMVAFKDLLYIFGGQYLKTSEIYHPKNNSWTSFPTNFEETTPFAASLVIKEAF